MFGGKRDADAPALGWHFYALRAVGWLLIAAIVYLAVGAGLHFRWWVFNVSDPIRFISDDMRGCYWGLVATGPEGYLNQYDKMDPQIPEWQDSLWVPWLDYVPLRLLVMRQWGEWVRAHHPPRYGRNLLHVWRRDYWFNEPVLHFNEVLEGIAAVCAFFLTRLWVLRGSAGEKHWHFHGTWQGLVAALCIWFSIDIIISAHAWFQWDSWPVPCYLCACLLASLDWWFAAGIAVAIGANLKGQMLSIAPVFIIWPLVQGRYGGALRWLVGMIFAMAVIASPWLLSYIPPGDQLNAIREIQDNTPVSQYQPDLFAIPRVFDYAAAWWIGGMLAVAAAAPWIVYLLARPRGQPMDRGWNMLWQPRRLLSVAGAAMVIAFVTFWPWLLERNRPSWHCGVLAAVVLAAAALLLRRRNQPYILAAVIGGGLLACIPLFHGETGWWDCGFHYGSIHWPFLLTGPASNIPALFELRFGWDQSVDQIAFTLPAIQRHWPGMIATNGWWPAVDFDVTAKMLFDTIYGVMLVVSGIAIGLQARRKDRRILVALVLPWLMFFLIPVQIQERYLLYGAGAAACCIGDSVGMALLGLMLTMLSATMQMIRLLDWDTADLDTFGRNLAKAFPHIFSPTSGRTMLQYMQAMHPDMAWAVLVIAGIFLYISLMPSRRRKVRSRPGPDSLPVPIPRADPPAI